MDQVRLDAGHPERRLADPTRDGHKLLELVLGGLRLPVPHTEAELRVVEQVQLCDERGDR